MVIGQKVKKKLYSILEDEIEEIKTKINNELKEKKNKYTKSNKSTKSKFIVKENELDELDELEKELECKK